MPPDDRSMNLFTRGAGWLRQQLLLQEPQNVTYLDTTAATAVVDVMEAGIRDDEAYRFATESANVGGGGTLDVALLGTGEIVLTAPNLPAYYDLEYATIALVSIENGGPTAQAVNVYHWLLPQNAALNYVRLGSGLALPGNGALAHRDLVGTPRPIFLPPGSALQLFLTTTAAETTTVRYQGIRIPARSFKSWL